jgi:hypothetical protein
MVLAGAGKDWRPAPYRYLAGRLRGIEWAAKGVASRGPIPALPFASERHVHGWRGLA